MLDRHHLQPESFGLMSVYWKHYTRLASENLHAPSSEMPAGMQLGSHCSFNELLFFDPVSTVVAILSLQTSHRNNTRSIANLPVFHILIKG
jgi:hypothetical protein